MQRRRGQLESGARTEQIKAEMDGIIKDIQDSEARLNDAQQTFDDLTTKITNIAVSSEPGQGTTFEIYFPRTKTLQPPVQAGEPLPSGKGLVPVVDDEQSIVDMLKEMLGGLGYDVAERYSSSDALQAFRARPDSFDPVITDLTMPHMTGIDLREKFLRAVQTSP